MTREQAKRLLDRLRMRTEARGATAAEAAQAADLAERIIRRYGLDQVSAGPVRQEAAVGQRRLPGWATVLSMAMERRFGVLGYWRKPDDDETSCHIIFEGPEHRVGVATWLWRAVVADLRRSCEQAAQELRRRGPALVRFRSQFLLAAAWEVFGRLNEAELRKMESRVAEQARERWERRRKKGYTGVSKRTWEQLARRDQQAESLGMDAGRVVAIDTNVLAEPLAGETLRIEHRSSAPKRQAALF